MMHSGVQQLVVTVIWKEQYRSEATLVKTYVEVR